LQTTLLGLAIALILALLAALIGPYFVNWNDHRAFFEAEASRLVGLGVRVTGPIKISMLPTPSMTLGDIEIGPPGQSSRLRARSLSIELGLGALMRGEIRAVEARLVGPQFGIGLNSLGRIDWPDMALHTDTVAIERLNIEDGRVVLTDALSNSRVVLDKLWFRGQVRSLVGPFRGEGAFVSAGEIHGYRVTAGRLTDDGMRVKLNVELAERPLTLEVDAVVGADRNAPRLEGSFALSRPAGSVKASGKAVAHEPWRLTGKAKANAQSALLEQIEFQYGPEERAAKLDGAAEIKFGERPRLQGALSARQIDLDRLIATPEAPRRLPVAATQAFAELFSGMMRPSIPVSLTVSIDMVTLGGAVLQAFGSDLRSDGAAWRIDKLEFRAPGFTRASASGRLEPSARGLGFDGSASIDVGDPKALLAWLGGESAATGQMLVKPWQLRGDVSFAADRIAVEGLHAEFERGAVQGRLVYRWPDAAGPAKLEAALKAADLDLDALTGFADGAFAGVGIEMPREIALAIEADRARFAGFEARDSTARLKLDPSGVQVERLSITDFGNASIEASGRIETTPAPGGSITLDLDARELGAVMAVADRFAPTLAQPLRRMAERDRTAKLRATVSLAHGDGGGAKGSLTVNGRIGAVEMNVKSEASGKPEHFAIANLDALAGTDVRFDGRFESGDAVGLLALVGLDRIAEAERLAGGGAPARLTIAAAGPMQGDLRFDGSLALGGIDGSGSGTLRLAGEAASLALDRVSGTIGGSKTGGKLTMRFGDEPRLDGAIETDALDVPVVAAAVIGMRARPGQTWSADPFAGSASGLAGRIEFKAAHATISDVWQARQLRGVVRFGPSQVVLDELEGELAGGRLGGRAAFATETEGVSLRARIDLNRAQAGDVIGGAAPPVTGRLTLHAEVEGSGRSPAAFIGSLTGRGSAVLEEAQFAGLNPRVFDAVARAADLGVSTESARIRDFVATALQTGMLSVPRAEANISIAAGQARITDVSAQAAGAELSMSANFDLADAGLDAVLRLTGATALGSGARPTLTIGLRGPWRVAARTIDATALSNWLSLREIERQSREIEEMERKRRDEEALRKRLEEEAERRRRDQEREEAARNAVLPASTPAGEAPASGNGTPPEPAAAPPLPPPINVVPTPRPRAEAPPRPAAPKPAPRPVAPRPPAPVINPPLDLLGAQR
jgi:large subunit ribosomal protein L24